MFIITVILMTKFEFAQNESQLIVRLTYKTSTSNTLVADSQFYWDRAPHKRGKI